MVRVAAGQATQLSPGLVAQVAAGIRFVLTGKAPGWFPAGDPMLPVAPPEVKGRQFDFPVHANITYTPRSESGETGVTFDQLRNLADSFDILRLVIETRKDQVGKLNWAIKNRDPKAKGNEAKIKEVTRLLEFPDGENDFHSWLRLLLEDLFVLDAPALYVRRTKGGKPLGFEPIDGATIKRLLDDSGRTPQTGPAYQQILKGMAAVDLSVDELIYAPRNRRTNRIYGYGPVEQIIVTVNMGIRRALGQLAFFTDGSVPEGILSVPDGWTSAQIEQYQDYWDGLLAGNLQQLRRVRMVPNGSEFQSIKPELLADKFDEWLARVVCYAFSVSPQPFVSQVNKATAETAAQQAIQEGLAPIQLWVSTLMNRILRVYLGHDDLEFAWEEEEDISPLEQATIDKTLIDAGVVTPNEVRDRRGLEPLPEPDPQPLPLPGAQPIPPTGAAPAQPGAAPATPAPAAAQGGEPTPKPKEEAAKVEKRSARTAGAVKPPHALPGAPKREAKIRAVVKKWARGIVSKVAAQVTAQMGKVAKDDGVDPILGAVNLNAGAMNDAIKAELLKMWDEAVEEAFAAVPASEVTPEMIRLVHEAGVKWADEHVGDLITNIDQTTKDLIRGDVMECINEGLSTSELADMLADNYAFSDSRAETIARTETAHAAFGGYLESWKESGVVEKAQFLAAPECCPDCEDRDGEDVSLDTDPESITHPNCRCNIVAVLADESAPTPTEE